MTPRLTIVLPLKGRPLFTLRFLWHANREKLPYRFVIADGQVDARLASLLENSRELFPNLDVEYVRYPDDASFGDYFRKMADALRRVHTPYVMLADNDDFLVRSGLDASVEFLDANADYVCCGGGIGGFAVYRRPPSSLGGVLGPLNQLRYRYMPYDRSIDIGSSSVTERLASGLRNSWSYYAVFRTPALQTIWDEVVELDLSDLQLHEKYCAMRTLTLGKARSDAATIAYFRQYWTTLRSAFSKDWVHHLLRNRFTTDFANIIERISDVASKSDKGDKNEIAERVRQRVEPWLRDFLRLNYGLSGTVRGHLRARVPALLEWLKTRRRYSVSRERRALFATLRQHGAADDYLTALRAELAHIEDTVSGTAFRAFLESHAAALIPASVAAPATAAPLALQRRGPNV
ncbi:MAG TPA: TIGR00180 family glycosyltransferase [Pseudolabrys sp.]|nr:TIGR00180 family glycosyltransferase [Pseudolabrys sp.]